ncbi:hypothetical protein J2W14_002849 [Pseudarthrobacter oxydans]|uniref:DUF7793 family protein n=1 Tax=Pseudarthrobacter oxydans TaxID=1671 RepID=UPI00277FAA8E|nr:hypothetical protein [Pseudarthrobacter oxydans]MDP9983428.1 hypothetical protein [Pseudarthrobacter oxydans]
MTIEATAGPGELITAEPDVAHEAVPDVAHHAVPDVAHGAGVTTLGPVPIGVRLREGGIIEVALPANEEIEGPEARVAGAAVRALANGRRVPVLLVITGVVGVSVEARHVYSTSIAASAFALVGESPVDRVIAHYLLRSKTETIPAQFFLSEAEAIDWLGQYTSEH